MSVEEREARFLKLLFENHKERLLNGKIDESYSELARLSMQQKLNMCLKHVRKECRKRNIKFTDFQRRAYVMCLLNEFTSVITWIKYQCPPSALITIIIHAVTSKAIESYFSDSRESYYRHKLAIVPMYVLFKDGTYEPHLCLAFYVSPMAGKSLVIDAQSRLIEDVDVDIRAGPYLDHKDRRDLCKKTDARWKLDMIMFKLYMQKGLNGMLRTMEKSGRISEKTKKALKELGVEY